MRLTEQSKRVIHSAQTEQLKKPLRVLPIAKAIAGASFIEDPLKTATSNATDKASFVNNSALVKDVSTAADAVAADYALSAINYIDAAIAAIDTAAL
jgi:hypothetical protein